MASEDTTAPNQLKNYAQSRKGKKGQVLTTSWGAPIGDKANSLTVGRRGPILLQDRVLLDELAHFDRERIPERAVHAKGAGAFGYFETTHDVTTYTKAAPFSEVGKRTPVAVRFSTVSGENGSADTVRSPRGFAVKFYTEEGNWDLAGNNTPIFFIRDPILFPSFLHTQKRNPVTHLKDIDAYWDFMTLRPETMHQLLFTFSPRGIPDGYRYMHGFGSHTFKLVNKQGEQFYCKFHFKTNQGVRNLCPQKASQLCGSDPDYALRDLYNAIARGEFPSWTLSIQVMTFEQAESFRWNPFDMTKVWPQGEYPLIPVGNLVLDRNPRNHFAEVEQMAFCPAHMIPGIEASPDKMLQGRLFSYSDTLRHRLGTNFMQIPVNCPYRSAGFSGHYQRDGPANVIYDTEGAPNYFPNSFSGPEPDAEHVEPPFQVTGDVSRHGQGDDTDFDQPRTFWNVILKDEDRHFVINELSASLKSAQPFLQERALKLFGKVSSQLESGVREALNKHATSKM